MWDNIIKEKKTDMEGCKCKPAKSFAQRIIEYQEFISLVRRMRKAQKKIKGYSPTRIKKDRCQWENDLDNKAYLESEVDEYLKKMEDQK